MKSIETVNSDNLEWNRIAQLQFGWAVETYTEKNGFVSVYN